MHRGISLGPCLPGAHGLLAGRGGQTLAGSVWGPVHCEGGSHQPFCIQEGREGVTEELKCWEVPGEAGSDTGPCAGHAEAFLMPVHQSPGVW